MEKRKIGSGDVSASPVDTLRLSLDVAAKLGTADPETLTLVARILDGGTQATRYTIRALRHLANDMVNEVTAEKLHDLAGDA